MSAGQEVKLVCPSYVSVTISTESYVAFVLSEFWFLCHSFAIFNYFFLSDAKMFLKLGVYISTNFSADIDDFGYGSRVDGNAGK